MVKSLTGSTNATTALPIESQQSNDMTDNLAERSSIIENDEIKQP